MVIRGGFPLTLHKIQGVKSPNHQSKPPIMGCLIWCVLKTCHPDFFFATPPPSKKIASASRGAAGPDPSGSLAAGGYGRKGMSLCTAKVRREKNVRFFHEDLGTRREVRQLWGNWIVRAPRFRSQNTAERQRASGREV